MPKRIATQPHRRNDRAEYDRLMRERNREHFNAYERAYHAMRKSDPAYRARRKRSQFWARIKAKYGVTRDQYEAMLASQAGKYVICGGVLANARQVDVDHCHETGAVRGILCNDCNKGLGCFHDKPDRLRAAAKYLETKKNVRENTSCGFGIECSPLEA